MQSTPFMGAIHHRPPGAPPMRGGRARSAAAGKQMVHGSGGTLHVSFSFCFFLCCIVGNN